MENNNLTAITKGSDEANINYSQTVGKSLKRFFGNALKISLTNPSQAFFP
ncbi:MAG: hypothetical protein U5N58_00550 [Actinomycetota bacterium]|nr:hypothetical protein [Actinomycetota bacterium]